jgi:hypothetical protein
MKVGTGRQMSLPAGIRGRSQTGSQHWQHVSGASRRQATTVPWAACCGWRIGRVIAPGS